ncbi:MAG: hypothetical protein ACP5UK_02995, partial [Conexivisphaera sp.]
RLSSLARSSLVAIFSSRRLMSSLVAKSLKGGDLRQAIVDYIGMPQYSLSTISGFSSSNLSTTLSISSTESWRRP